MLRDREQDEERERDRERDRWRGREIDIVIKTIKSESSYHFLLNQILILLLSADAYGRGIMC